MKVFQSVFTGPPAEVKGEVPKPMLIGMIILAVLVITFGLVPGLPLKYLVGPAARSLAAVAGYVSKVLGVVG